MIRDRRWPCASARDRRGSDRCPCCSAHIGAHEMHPSYGNGQWPVAYNWRLDARKYHKAHCAHQNALAPLLDPSPGASRSSAGWCVHDGLCFVSPMIASLVGVARGSWPATRGLFSPLPPDRSRAFDCRHGAFGTGLLGARARTRRTSEMAVGSAAPPNSRGTVQRGCPLSHRSKGMHHGYSASDHYARGPVCATRMGW